MKINPAQVSLVIVSWNAKEYLFECLESLREKCSAVAMEVIVVDNASSDGTCDLIESRFPEVKLIRNSTNAGFAKGNNIGVAQCSGEFVCLVNSDVKFVNDCFTPMLAYMEDHPNVSMIGPKMLGIDGNVRRSTMRFPTLWNSFCRALAVDHFSSSLKIIDRQLNPNFTPKITVDVEVLNGWFVMVRRSTLKEVGLLDERFFMYGEDIDWCYRFHRAGYRAVYFADAEAIHYGGASSANAPLRFYIEMYRANLQYWRKHHGRFAAWIYLVMTWVHQSIRCLGYSALLLNKKKRSAALFKIKRSTAWMSWILSSRHGSRNVSV